jgi:hypothetical protein
MQEGLHWKLRDVLQVKEGARQVRATAGKPAARVEARAAAARRGGAGRVPAAGGERRARYWSGTWREERRPGQLWLGHMASEGGGGGAERNTERRTGGRRKRTKLQFSKSAGTLL